MRLNKGTWPRIKAYLKSENVGGFCLCEPGLGLVTHLPRGEAGDQFVERLVQRMGAANRRALEEVGLKPTFRGNIPQPLHLLGEEIRPGSGVIRMIDGQPRGQAGTLTCFLASQDLEESYLLAAAHVLTNYWEAQGDEEGNTGCRKAQGDKVKSDPRESVEDPRAAVFRNLKGFPSSTVPRCLGTSPLTSGKPFTLQDSICEPDEIYENLPCHGDPPPQGPPLKNELDAGIVKIEAGFFAPRQRTTCYGSFGDVSYELSSDPHCGPTAGRQPHCTTAKALIRKGQKVTKCGAEEPHGGVAWVECTNYVAKVIGPPTLTDPCKPETYGEPNEYIFLNQVLLSMNPPPQRGVIRAGDGTEGVQTLADGSYRLADGSWSGTGCERPSVPPFASPGDSGTMVVDAETRVPLGMIFAGSVLTGHYVMTPITTLERFWEAQGLVLLRG